MYQIRRLEEVVSLFRKIKTRGEESDGTEIVKQSGFPDVQRLVLAEQQTGIKIYLL